MSRALYISFPIFCLILSASPRLGAEEQALSDLNLKALEKKEEALKWGRDPFAFSDPAKEFNDKRTYDGGFRLSAIIYREGKGVAIINDKIVRTGDRLDGMNVREIRQDRVILSGGSGERELRVDQFPMGPD